MKKQTFRTIAFVLAGLLLFAQCNNSDGEGNDDSELYDESGNLDPNNGDNFPGDSITD